MNAKRHTANPFESQKWPENRYGTRTWRAYTGANCREADEHGMPVLAKRVRKMNPRRAKKAWARAEAGAKGRAESAIRNYVMIQEIMRIDQSMLANAR